MRWTREKPTEPGWYWVRYLDDLGVGTGAAPCRVEEATHGTLWGGDPHQDLLLVRIDQWPDSTEWQGPIRPEEADDGE